MRSLVQELKIAFESLTKRTGFVLTVVVTLGVTLGAMITFFNLNHVLLVKPLPYPDQEQLFITQHVSIDPQSKKNIGLPLVPGLVHSYKYQQSFSEMAILSAKAEFLISHPEKPRLEVTFTTPEYFELLAVPMHLGRSFGIDAGIDKNNPVVVLSYHSWQTWFQGAQDVIGQKIQIRETNYTVIGVVGKNFIEPEIINQGSDVWLPWDFNGMNDIQLTNWSNGQGNIAGLGKLNDSLSISQAETELTTLMNGEFQAFRLTLPTSTEVSSRMAISLQPLKTKLLGDSRARGLLLMGAVIGLLIIASTNVVNLFYSRAAEKQRTFAIQVALGAHKKHLFLAMFAESILLTTFSCLMGLLISLWGIDLVKQLGQGQFNRLDELGLDVITLVFTLVVTVLLATIFAYLSSRVVNYDALQEQLQNSGKGSGLQISKRARNTLVFSQIALASLLLAGASLILSQAFSVINQPLGYNTQPLRSFSLDVRAGLIPENEIELRDQRIVELKSKLLQLPQVVTASPSFNTPIGYNMTMSLLDIDNINRGQFPTNFVAEDYFQTLQLPVIEGRMFSAAEVRNRDEVVVLSESAANDVGRGQNPIGLKVKVGSDKFKTVIGIVNDVFDPTRSGNLQSKDIYLPHAPWNMHFVIRLQNNVELSRQQLVQQVQSVDRNLRVANYHNFEEQHHRVIRQNKITAIVAVSLSVLGLILAGTGIYGVISYSSHMRRYELGIRMALGAKSRQIIHLVIKDNMTPISIGLLFSSLIMMTVLAFNKQQINLSDELSLLPLIMVIPIILLTAFFASYMPIRNVIRKDPIQALKSD
jgi:predicted permease